MSNQHDLGTFSISLTVEDIQASYDFYQKLGFKHLEGAGSVKDKWMILQNGSTNIGLFQDMFPQNIMTFNPTNAREIHKSLTDQGIEVTASGGLDKDSGPCHFSFVDPDGNPVLIDQHV